MVDEALLQVAAGMVDSSEASVRAAAHLLTDSPHLCDQSMQGAVQARHAQQCVPVSLTHHLHAL